MFKSIRWKFTVIFTALLLAAEILSGAVMLIHTVNYFHKDFRDSIDAAFNDDIKTQLFEAAATVASPEEYVDENNNIIIQNDSQSDISGVRDILKYVEGTIGISRSRFYAILDGGTGNVMYASTQLVELPRTAVLTNALNGDESIKSAFSSPYMDYALPLKSNDNIKYIVYVKDTEENQRDLIKEFTLIMLYALLISAAAALIIGGIISKMITTPLKDLTAKAKKLADGDINAVKATDSKDEIGDLTNSLLYLAHSRQGAADVAKSEKLKVETILQNLNDGILAFDMNGRVIHVNPEAQRLLQMKYLDDINFDRFFKEINVDILLGDLIYMKPSGSVERAVKLNNQFLQLNFATFEVDNKVSGIIVIIHDITRQEKLEQSRLDFVANVSHELRTPLTTIKSYSETLADMPEADKELRTRFLDVIASEADRMANIISDLLTLSALNETQNYFKPSEQIDVRKMLESLVDRMGLQAKKKNQSLVYHPINDIPVINGDYGGLERVFINIISNALKYTRDGGVIEVFSSRVYSDINIKVKDNGIGIPEESLPHIFDRFYRVDRARSRDTGGTGLGLAIAKQTLESCFKGKIKITSEVGTGTEVTITIPVSENGGK